ncbi:MAG TPA: GNAT family N-acetyltransferase [Clostridiales bacterium]|nr:GNAT family N-acetyltransferase [Clostridiales bacterium]
MNIRKATMHDLSAITAVEAECFPAAEAATEIAFKARLTVYPNHFWLLEDDGKLVSFINGMVTDEPTIRDEMFENALLHNESGNWQAIFGVNTIPEYRQRGCAAKVMEQVIKDAKSENRKGCILTCKQELIHYYEKFGFVNIGISNSAHGGAVWYDMRLSF